MRSLSDDNDKNNGIDVISNKGDFTKYDTVDDLLKDWILVKPESYDIKLEEVVEKTDLESSKESEKNKI